MRVENLFVLLVGADSPIRELLAVPNYFSSWLLRGLGFVGLTFPSGLCVVDALRQVRFKGSVMDYFFKSPREV